VGTYLLRRFLLMIPTLFGITFVTFAIIRIAPGDPVEMNMGGPGGIEGDSGGGDRARADIVRKAKIELGLLDKEGKSIPIWEQYGTWLARTARLDFGRSFKDQRRVIDKISAALPITLTLSLTSILLAYLVSIPLGVYSAIRRNKASDHVVTTVLFLLYSSPNFLVGTLLILTLGRAGILPFVGLHSPGHERLGYLPFLWDHATHIMMPVACFTYASFAFLSRLVRSGMLENLGLDYVRTARAKGLPERDVVLVHALRNSLIPVVTLMGNILPALIGGSVIIESIFTIDGLGYLGFQSVLSRDYPVIMAITTITAVLTMLGILVSDVLYVVVDPRIAYE
jgi:peptide/nickel transport system permease protein